MQINLKRKRDGRPGWIGRAITGCFCGVLMAGAAMAQGRMNDKDVETLLNNLKNDSQTFRSNPAVGKSAIRNTSQEWRIPRCAESFALVLGEIGNYTRSRFP